MHYSAWTFLTSLLAGIFLHLSPAIADPLVHISPKDLAELHREAREGHVPAQFFLAEIYYRGDQLPRNLAKAIYWYKRAAKNGEPQAQFALGRFYLNGLGVKKDARRAASYLLEASRSWIPDAHITLAEMYRVGNGVPQSYAEAYKWYYIAAMKFAGGQIEERHSAFRLRDEMAKMMTADELSQAKSFVDAWHPE